VFAADVVCNSDLVVVHDHAIDEQVYYLPLVFLIINRAALEALQEIHNLHFVEGRVLYFLFFNVDF